nr:mavicyanin-like [Nicotiana tomentosiformis]
MAFSSGQYSLQSSAMTFTKRTLFCFITAVIATSMRLSMATVYEVGDSQGWTIIGKVDYNHWASTKKFQVNDTLIFNYNKYHNVMQVSSQEYESCTVTSPIATLNTGKDSFTLSAPGDYYYICGIPGHCQIGQKVYIKVGSQTNGASPLYFMWFPMGLLGLCFFLIF